MHSINNLNIAGYVTRDAVTYRTRNGHLVSHITIALNRRYRTASGVYDESTTFVDVTLWDGRAEFACDNIRKGDFVHVEGRLDTDHWTDSATNQLRHKMIVVANSVTLQKKAPRPQMERPAIDVSPQPAEACVAACL
jgi:single-strand DNA-binding protein